MQCRRHKRHGFDPQVGKTPWRRKWHPTPVFLPGESHGQRSLVGCSPWGDKESVRTEGLSTQTAFRFLMPMHIWQYDDLAAPGSAVACRVFACGAQALQLLHTGSRAYCAIVARQGLVLHGMWDLSCPISHTGSRAYCAIVARQGLVPHGMWDLSCPIRDQTRVPYIARWILKHWTTGKVPSSNSLFLGGGV